MMGTKTISFSLDRASIDRAIREVRMYKADFERKVTELRKKIGERIAWSASLGFRTALVADIVHGEEPANDVRVSVEHGDKLTVVFADGEQAVFIEYGAGVYNNGPAGSSPHPWGADKGFLIGTYGQGKGQRDIWGYCAGGSKDSLVLTHGTPAAMPMYRGWQEALNAMDDMVREVFG